MDDEKGPRLVDKVKKALDEIQSEGDGDTAGSISISANGTTVNQVIGGGYIDQSTRVEKILPAPVIVKTGDGVLDAHQKAEITRLVNEVVEDSKARKSLRTLRSVWSQLDRHMRVNSYAEILSEDFARARSFLMRIKAIDNSLPSARKKNPEWRQRRIRAIQARCRERGLDEWRKKYMKEKFRRDSMVDMPDSEIETLYRAVMGKK